MQELNPLSDVKKNIEWEINICSTLAPKLSLIGGKPDHDWLQVAVFNSPIVELPLWHLFSFFSFFFFFPDAKSWGCGLYTGAAYTTLLTVLHEFRFELRLFRSQCRHVVG